MSRSLLKTLLALAALVALLGLGACGGDDEEGGDTGGTPAQTEEGGGEAANVTEQLFAGSAADNRAKPDEGKKGGKLTVLSGGDVDYMDPGKTYYSYALGDHGRDPPQALHEHAKRSDQARAGPRRG